MVYEHLKSEVAILPGGRDLEEHPLIFVNANLSNQLLQDHLEETLKYFSSIFSVDSRRKGLCVIVNAQQTTWRTTRHAIRMIDDTLKYEIALLIVLRSEAFWDKQKADKCAWVHRKGEPIYIPASRLHKYVSTVHLPVEFGGTWIYDHALWIENRNRVQKFMKNAENVITELESTRHYFNNISRSLELNIADSNTLSEAPHKYDSAKDNAQQSVDAGVSLTDLLQNHHTEQQRHLVMIPQDLIDTKDRINRLLEIIQGKMTLVQESWLQLNKKTNDAKEINFLEQGVRQVTDWILCTGETMLNSQQDVGFDVSSAETLRQNHERLEMNCRDTYGQYAELLHKLQLFLRSGPPFPEDLLSQKEFMDFVCRSFATRMERRRIILITSVRFFRLVSEYFQVTSDIYENLIMNGDMKAIDTIQSTLIQLENCQTETDELERNLVKEGEKLLDLLSMPVKDALGRELQVNYEGDITNIQEILHMTTSRKHLFWDSIELQKLTLQQVILINRYECDAAEALEWLNELYKVMLKSHSHVGSTIHEIQLQKRDHQCFHDTAKGTFEFGCQLLNAALTLRQSCKLAEQVNDKLTQKIWQSWKNLYAVNQEQLTRLRVSAVFYRNVELYCDDLRQITEKLNSIHKIADKNKQGSELQVILNEREKVLLEVGRMVRLGRLLKTRLRETVCQEKSVEEINDDNEIAIEAINDRLTKVTMLAEKLDAAICNSKTLTQISNNPKLTARANTSNCQEWCNEIKNSSEESSKSDEDFFTASECAGTPPSRASSFHSAYEGELATVCERDTSPWWEDVNAPQRSLNTDHITPRSYIHIANEEVREPLTKGVTEKSLVKLSPFDSCNATVDSSFFDKKKDKISSTDMSSSLNSTHVVEDRVKPTSKGIWDRDTNSSQVSSIKDTIPYSDTIVKQALAGVF